MIFNQTVEPHSEWVIKFSFAPLSKFTDITPIKVWHKITTRTVLREQNGEKGKRRKTSIQLTILLLNDEAKTHKNKNNGTDSEDEFMQ